LTAVLGAALVALAVAAPSASAVAYQPVNEISMLGIEENSERGTGYARGLAVDPVTHDIFMAGMLGEGRLHKWDAGENETVFGREEFFGYFGVTVDPQKHDIFALNATTKRVEHYLPSLKKATPTFFQTDANGMIVTGPEGHIFIAHSPEGFWLFPGGEQGSIEEYNRAGELLQTIECTACPGVPSFHGPIGEALDAAGNLYVADKGNNRVIKMERVGAVYMNPTVFSTGPSSTVAVDRATGRVFVGGDEPPAEGSEEPGPFYVTVYDSTGSNIGEFGKGFIEDQFPRLGGGAQVTVDQGDGHVFVSSTHLDQVSFRVEPRVYEFANMVPPIVETDPATVEASRHVTLNAEVNPNGNLVRDCHFEYGPTTEYGTFIPCSPDPGFERMPVNVSAEVSGLQPNTSYHFRVVVTNEGGTTEGADEEFTTLIDKPAVVTGAPSSVNSFGATVSGTVNPLSNPVTSCQFEYGLTSAYGSVVSCPGDPGVGGAPVAEAVALSGLEPSTTYHYRLLAANAGGTEPGADATFTTLAPTPKAVTGAATNVVADGAKVAGTVNPQGSVTNWRFEYGPTGAYGHSTPLVSAVGSEDIKVSSILSSLEPATTFHYRLVATNVGGTTHGSDQTFTTGARPIGRIYIPAKAPLDGHTAQISLQCRGVTIAECKGTLTLRARIKKGIRFILVKAGSADFDLFGGKTMIVDVALNAAGRKALSQSEGKPLPAVASATGKNRVVRLEQGGGGKRRHRGRHHR
jgi:hypothetical protein